METPPLMKPAPASWRSMMAKYEDPRTLRSLWQVATTVVPYLILFAMMYASLEASYWLTLALAVPATGFLLRSFVIFHDCTHGSFLRDRKMNDMIGRYMGLLTFTPFYMWRYEHNKHHATSGDLDRRGVGDVWTLTIQEYRALPKWRRAVYRMFRNPWFLFTIGAVGLSLVLWRFTTPASGRREKASVYWTNAMMAAVIAAMHFTIGLKAFILVQMPLLALSSSVGVWLFYVQHQFDGVYWARHEKWSYFQAALLGSSFYKLPVVLNWFTGSIGYHHIHHLGPAIPNYNLIRAYRENPMFRDIKPLTLLSSLKSLGFRLYDEERRRLVGFDSLNAA